MARESHLSSRHLAAGANASTTPGAQYIGEGDRFRRHEGHDVWGHWGTYYGPMVPQVPRHRRLPWSYRISFARRSDEMTFIAAGLESADDPNRALG
jgi:hypothetical protein